MGFCFKRTESVPKGVKRIARERIEAALWSLKARPGAEAVHGIRKDIKKVRAVLRLARDRIPKKVYGRQTKLLRKAADRLAPTRDAYVRGAALRNLTEHFQGQLRRGVIRALQKKFDGDLAHAETQFVGKKSASKVKRLLKRIPKELGCRSVDAKGWKMISPGIKRACAQGRQAYLVARQWPSSEHLHDWRKRVKDLWYQVRVLRPISPKRLDAIADELKILSEYLGDDHDLLMLEKAVSREGSVQLELFERGVLNGMIQQRRRELQASALKAGERIFAEKPEDVCGRLARYWEAWRHGK